MASILFICLLVCLSVYTSVLSVFCLFLCVFVCVTEKIQCTPFSCLFAGLLLGGLL